MAGWPSSTGNNTMSKRSASRQQQFSSGYHRQGGAPSGGGGAHPPFDSLIKDYTKKRWLILALLSVEVVFLNINWFYQFNHSINESNIRWRRWR